MAGRPFRPTAVLASAGRALRGVLEAGRWLWLVRPRTAEAIGAIAVVLLDALSGLLVAAAQGFGWHV
ncbi:MAG: hypothetical protein IPK66_05775 [Rhodospirillales bacterium]|nr:hypothetical protein [Rhodospirillales bacterium]